MNTVLLKLLTKLRWKLFVSVFIYSFCTFCFAMSSNYSPDIQQWVTQKGSRVLFVHADTLPLVDIKVAFDAGAARDNSQGGLARLTNQMLSAGTAEIDADTVAKTFDTLGAQIEFVSERDMAVVSLRTMSDAKYLNPALDLFAKIIAFPAFDDVAFQRERKRALVALKMEAQDPASTAYKEFYKVLYSGQPYANSKYGTENSLNALTPDNLRAFHKKYYVAKNAVIAIVGAVKRDVAEMIVTELEKNLATGEMAAKLPAVNDLKHSSVQNIDFPSQQTHIIVGGIGIKRNDTDYFPLYVGNHILGSTGLVSRIFKQVREEQGLAYDARSYFIPMKERGPYIIRAQTRNEKASKTLELISQIVDGYLKEGPTDEELIRAKDNISGSFALRLDSNRAIAHNLAMMGFYDLPTDYLATYRDKIRGVTKAQVKEAFSNRIHPENFAVVMVGKQDKNQIEKQ